MNIQEVVSMRSVWRIKGSRKRFAGMASRSNDAIAMEDLLYLGDVVREGLTLLHGEVARPGEVDVDDAVDAAGPGRDDADLGRQLHRLLDAVGHENDGWLRFEP